MIEDLIETHEQDEVEDLLQGRIDTLHLDVRLLISDCLELCRQYRGHRDLADAVAARLLAAADILNMRQ